MSVLLKAQLFESADDLHRYYVKGRIDEGDQVLSALHDLPLDDPHVQGQRRQIFEAVEIEMSQKPFNPLTLIWDNSGTSLYLPSLFELTTLTIGYKELQAGRRLRTSFIILCLQQLMGM